MSLAAVPVVYFQSPTMLSSSWLIRHETRSFRIEVEFWCSGRRWRCTDIGTRVVVGVCFEPHEVVTVTSNVGASATTTRQRSLLGQTATQ